MPLGTYDTGTISVTQGSSTVTGSGVLWDSIKEFDILSAGGSVAYIDSVSDLVNYDEITLKGEWRGPTLLDQPYLIVRMPADDIRLTQEIGELLAFLDLQGIMYFVTGDEPDPAVGDDGQWAIKKIDAPPGLRFWVKIAGLWEDQGTFGLLGLTPRGAWAVGTTYHLNDLVSRTGNTYLGLRDTIGDPPESSPDDWQLFTTSGTRYDLIVDDPSKPYTGEVLARVVFSTTAVFHAGLADSRGKAVVAATGSTVFSLRKNGVQFGTATFAPGGTVPTFAAAADVVFDGVDDLLEVVAPAQDATLSTITMTITCFR